MNDAMSTTPDDLFTALHRESELVADNLGISLTADELRQVKERLILTWVVEHLTGHEMLSVADLLRRYPGDDEAQIEAVYLDNDPASLSAHALLYGAR